MNNRVKWGTDFSILCTIVSRNKQFKLLSIVICKPSSFISCQLKREMSHLSDFTTIFENLNNALQIYFFLRFIMSDISFNNHPNTLFAKVFLKGIFGALLVFSLILIQYDLQKLQCKTKETSNFCNQGHVYSVFKIEKC